MKRFVAPILPWAMLSASLATIALWPGKALGPAEPLPSTAMIYLGGGVLLALLSWLCFRLASRGSVNLTGIVVVAFGGTMSSIICWGAHDKFGPLLRAFPMCMIIVVIGALFAPRLWHLVLGFVATMGPTTIVLVTSSINVPQAQEIYRSLMIFTFATALTLYLLAHRIKQSYFSLLVDHQERSVRDSLTGLYNRQGWYERCEATLRVQGSATLSILYLDVDHFKRVNDLLGHAEGDRVLQAIGATLTATLDHDAIISRFGGEEFVVLLPGASAAQAGTLALGIQTALESITDESWPLSVSIGVAERTAGETLVNVVLRADHALLRAKALGRNRIEVAGSTLILPTFPKVEPMGDAGEVICIAPTGTPALTPVLAASERQLTIQQLGPH
jgi:diguanylate cyclase (GGDEF)-like protein